MRRWVETWLARLTCDSRRLQLNPTKTELIWFGSRANLQKIATADQSLCIDRDMIHSVASLMSIGVDVEATLLARLHFCREFSHIRVNLQATFLTPLKPHLRRPTGYIFITNLGTIVSTYMLHFCHHFSYIHVAMPVVATTFHRPHTRLMPAVYRLILYWVLCCIRC